MEFPIQLNPQIWACKNCVCPQYLYHLHGVPANMLKKLELTYIHVDESKSHRKAESKTFLFSVRASKRLDQISLIYKPGFPKLMPNKEGIVLGAQYLERVLRGQYRNFSVGSLRCHPRDSMRRISRIQMKLHLKYRQRGCRIIYWTNLRISDLLLAYRATDYSGCIYHIFGSSRIG